MQPFTSDSVSTAPSPSIRPPSENEAGKGIIINYNCATVLTLCCIAPGTCAECTTMIAVSAVSLLLNITLATVILIHCLLSLSNLYPL